MSRILLIEADPGERMVLRSRLIDSGHEVVLAENGARGLGEARTSAMDLVLLAADLGHGVDGSEVCRRLKATPGLNRIPVVVFAGQTAGVEVAERMYDAGCEVFVGRPQMASLDRVIEVQLRIKARGDELNEQNHVLELENRRLEEERQRAADLDSTRTQGNANGLVVRELAAGRPDGVLLVDSGGVVRQADRGARELLGARLIGSNLGRIAPGLGLEAFVRDARNTPQEGFRFDLSARKDRAKRSLTASVVPVTASEDGQPYRVVLLLDIGKRRVAEEMLRAQEPGIPRQQLGALIEAARATFVPSVITGTSDRVRQLRADVARLMSRSGPVLVRGERGVGKLLVSRVLHYSGPRTGCFLQLRCSSLAPETLEAELFGVTKDASDREVADRPGMLLVGQDGTLFLGEVTDLPFDVQTRLAEVIASGTLQRRGAKKKERVDCRIIASTARDLPALVAEGRFDAHLAELLSADTIDVPSLRERPIDVHALCAVFIERFGPRQRVDSISEEATWIMEQYDWPGNVAELEDCIEQACSRADGRVVEVCHLTRPLRDLSAELPDPHVIPARRGAVGAGSAPTAVPGTHLVNGVRRTRPWEITEEDEISLEVYERKVLLRALDHTGGDRLAAARLLNVGKSTLYRKLKKFEIS